MKKIFFTIELLFFTIFSLQAQDRQDSLKQILENKTMDTVYFKTLYNLAIDYERKDPEIAKMYFKKHIKEMEGSSPDKWLAFTFIRFAGVYSSQGLRDSAEIFFEKAENYLTSNGAKKVLYIYYTCLGIHQNRYGQYFEALASYQEVEKVDIDILGKMNLAGNYLNMSNVYKSLGMVDEQIETIFKSLAIFEEIQQLMGLSYCYNALATLYHDQKEYEKAEEYLLKSYDLRVQQHDKRGEAVVLGNLGNVMMDTERYEEAMANFRRASTINEEFGLKDLWSNMHLNLAKVNLKIDQADSALSYLESALSLLYSHSESANTAPILLEVGKVHRIKNNPVLAEKYLKDALAMATEKKDAHSRKSTYIELSHLYKLTQNFKSALDYNHRFQQLKDSMESADLKLKLQGLEAKYAFDKKETEISLLKAEKELAQLEVEKQNGRQVTILAILLLVVIIAFLLVNRYRLMNRAKRLLEIEKMRLGIAQDLHDDIGSTLSSIQIISKVAQCQNNGNTQDSLKKIERQAALILDNLGDIVWSLKVGEARMEDLVMKMNEFALELLEPLDITFEFKGTEYFLALNLDLEKRKNIFLIFKEALNNAAKYSSCSSVIAHFLPSSEDKHGLELQIQDDGAGFDLQEVRKGNGLMHMQERAKKMNGMIHIDTQREKGTVIRLALASHV
jgi:signal transduction histidine kinase